MHLVKSLLVLASSTPLVVARSRGNLFRRQAGYDSNGSSSSFLPTPVLTPSSSTSPNYQSSLTLAGTAPLGTGISASPQTTQEVVLTDVVYTTLTTCPVTSLVTSGSTSFEEITTTISTVTRTRTSTLCTKCVAPPTNAAGSSSSPGETAISSLPSSTIISFSQPSLSLPLISTYSAAGAQGTGGLSATLFTSNMPAVPLQTGISSQPEVPGTASSPSRGLIFPSSVSLTISATLGASSTLEFPGYGIVPSPISTPGSPRERITANATSSVIPVYTPALLGNAYGGGFVGTPSIYVTPLPYPNGPSSGVPPGYGSQSSVIVVQNNVTATLTGLSQQPSSGPSSGVSPGYGPQSSVIVVQNNVTATLTGLEASSASAVGLQSTTEIGVPVLTATIASNVSVLFGSLGASTAPATSSENKSVSPTFISLSPFGGEIGQGSFSSAVLSGLSSESASSLSSIILGIGASTVSPATASAQIGNSESGGANTITAFVLATPPAAALSAEISQVSNAVLSSLAAAGVSASSVNLQVAVIDSSTTSVIGASGVTEASIVPTTSVASIVLSPNLLSSGVNIEAIPAASPTSGEVAANIIPSLPAEQSVGPLVTLAIGSSLEQTAAAGQPIISAPTPNAFAGSTTTPSIITSPVIGANGQTLAAVQPAASLSTPVIVANGSPVIGANGETLTASQPAAYLPTPIIVANGNTAIAVVPSPVVGANGLTSLAIFSTPIAPAAGLTTPSVLLTPVVGANGLTSLAVVATPVVGANGLTSLAIGFETEASPAASQSNSASTPVEGFMLVQSPTFAAQVSGGVPIQSTIAASGVNTVVVPSGSGESPASGGSEAGNYSIHVPLNPTAATHFQGSAIRLSLGFGVGFISLMVFFVLL